MNIELLMKAGIDYEEGLRRFCGHEAIYHKYLFRMLEDQTFAGFCKAMDDKDYDTAFRQAHTLKGMLGNISMNALYAQMNKITEQLRDGRDIPGAIAAYPMIAALYDDTIIALNEARTKG